VRAAITLTLLATLLGILGIAFYSAHGDYQKTKEILDKVFTALVGLIGSALGFYFGSKNNSN
jgi:branched-subunit amino acid permease